MNIWNARQMHLSGLTNHAELITTHIRRSLVRLARGKDEFSPRFAKGAAGNGDDPALYAASHACYHLAQISTHIPLEELDLRRWRRLIPTYESSALFHAGLCLYIFARLSSTSADPGASSTFDSSSRDPGSFSSSTESAFPLDAALYSSLTPVNLGSWLALGGPASLTGVSGLFSDSSAPMQVLRRIGQVFAVVLKGIARRDEEQQKLALVPATLNYGSAPASF
ncbi:hypothetical protein BJY59DRAFT_722213 [Rhodotorula toruloides]